MPDRGALTQLSEDGSALAMLKQSEYWPALERLFEEMLENRFGDILTANMDRIQHDRGRYFGVREVRSEIDRRVREAQMAREALRGR